MLLPFWDAKGMAHAPFKIRTATISDAYKIASVNVAAWHETYTGLLPAEILSGVTEAVRAKRWISILNSFDETNGHAAFLAETHGVPLGYVSVGSQRDKALADQGFSAEVTSIYVLQKSQRMGVGRALLRQAAHHLHHAGHSTASLWVLEANTNARRFYKALGGHLVSKREDIRPEATLCEVAYGWHNLSRLLE